MVNSYNQEKILVSEADNEESVGEMGLNNVIMKKFSSSFVRDAE